MNMNLNLGKSLLLLAAPLVASWNLGISSSSAAIITGYEVEEANTKEIIYQRVASDFDTRNINKFERYIFEAEDLLSMTRRDTPNNSSVLGDYMTSTLGHLFVQINDVWAPTSQTESTAVLPVNNLGAQSANSRDTQSVYTDEDPFKIFLKSIDFEEHLNTDKNKSPTISYTDYTDRVERVKIKLSPVSEDSTIKAPSENNSATVATTDFTSSSEPLNTKTTPKLAQLPTVGSTKNPESFDIVPVVGSALGLGFLIWMLFQD
jgi:hypothetical protein